MKYAILAGWEYEPTKHFEDLQTICDDYSPVEEIVSTLQKHSSNFDWIVVINSDFEVMEKRELVWDNTLAEYVWEIQSCV